MIKHVKIFLLLCITSCTKYQTPELPDLNQQSFEYKVIINNQTKIQQNIQKIKEENIKIFAEN